MKNLPLGIQTFSDMIEQNYLYVDKTEEIHKLVSGGGKYYFLSRPRRFGKSLLISTLFELFSGNKELFRGLWIYDKLSGQRYPIIHLDFTLVAYESGAILKQSLEETLQKIADPFAIRLTSVNYKTKFEELIEKLASLTKERVVILIDEYDKPIIDFLDIDRSDLDVAEENRDILRNFYATIKGADKYLRFVFITGVSKFSKVSVFSGLNNLDDITLDERYSTMLGYTHDELLHYFDDRLHELRDTERGTGLVEDIKTWYNGYSWDGKSFVYSPFSILKFFHKKKFGNYWFESGSPTFLVNLIRRYRVDVEKLEHYKAGEAVFGSFDIDRMHVVSLLFQTGYMTIKEIMSTGRGKRFYILSYPNAEVKEAFMEYLLGDFSSQFAEDIGAIVEDLKSSLETGNIDKFFGLIRSLFAQIPYDMFVRDREGYYQTVIYLILKLIGIGIQTEVETNLGRIDAAVETADHIYVMEFKLGTAQEALSQIKEKKYYEKYAGSPKSLHIIGVGLDIEQRNIADYKSEPIDN